MLNSREKEIQERRAATTPGHWWMDYDHRPARMTIGIEADGSRYDPWYILHFVMPPDEESDEEVMADCDFITKVHETDIPYLLETVGRLRGLLDRTMIPLDAAQESAKYPSFAAKIGRLRKEIDAELESCEAQ